MIILAKFGKGTKLRGKEKLNRQQRSGSDSRLYVLKEQPGKVILIQEVSEEATSS